jgi:hypothetical protein
VTPDWLDRLPRTWVFPDLGELRPSPDPRPATYVWWPLDGLPPVGLRGRSAIVLLLAHAPADDAIGDEEAVGSVDGAALDAILGVGERVGVPGSLDRVVRDPEPRRRIRSVTACFLDLGEELVPVEGGGWLLHLVSDQQWVVHWLVLLTREAGPGPVIASTIPFGFPFAGDAPRSFDRTTAADQSVERTVVCADSIDEFLARFFLENEAWRAAHPGYGGRYERSPEVEAYIAALRAPSSAG